MQILKLQKNEKSLSFNNFPSISLRFKALSALVRVLINLKNKKSCKQLLNLLDI